MVSLSDRLAKELEFKAVHHYLAQKDNKYDYGIFGSDVLLLANSLDKLVKVINRNFDSTHYTSGTLFKQMSFHLKEFLCYPGSRGEIAKGAGLDAYLWRMMLYADNSATVRWSPNSLYTMGDIERQHLEITCAGFAQLLAETISALSNCVNDGITKDVFLKLGVDVEVLREELRYWLTAGRPLV
jgi:hypothetical protein